MGYIDSYSNFFHSIRKDRVSRESFKQESLFTEKDNVIIKKDNKGNLFFEKTKDKTPTDLDHTKDLLDFLISKKIPLVIDSIGNENIYLNIPVYSKEIK